MMPRISGADIGGKPVPVAVSAGVGVLPDLHFAIWCVLGSGAKLPIFTMTPVAAVTMARLILSAAEEAGMIVRDDAAPNPGR